jgi:mannitol/fructose-specific phosphotransferase system IIA component (Ntr-type)
VAQSVIARTMHVGNGSQLRSGVARSIAANGRITSTYMGNGLAVAHGVSDALDEPVTFFGRSDSGIPLDGVERVHGLFVVLLPTRMRQAESETVDSVTSLLESEYVRERLLQAESPEAIVETLRTGMQVALD